MRKVRVYHRLDNPMNKIKVLVVDDHRVFRQGLIGLMNTRPDILKVVGEAELGRLFVKRNV